MTTEQAIKILNGAIKKPNTIDGYLGQALTMAINALKNQPEIIRCKYCKKHNLGIGDYIMEGKEKVWIWKPDACPLIQFRGYAEGHEFDYQYCCYGEKRGDAE